MADTLEKLEKIGYGQLELNQVAFPRDGRIEAQCALDPTVFSEEVPAENGMILAINRVKRTVGFHDPDAKNEILALNYTAEHMYDDRDLGSLRKFKLVPGTFYPRLGFLAVGDKFTTNTVKLITAWDELTDEALEAGIFVIPGTDGYWEESVESVTEGATVDPTEDATVVAQIIKKTTMPDGQKAVKLQIVKA